MSTLTYTGPAPTTLAYEDNHKTALLGPKTPTFLAVMVLMLLVAVAGVALSHPVMTMVAGFCTVLTAIATAFSTTYES